MIYDMKRALALTIFAALALPSLSLADEPGGAVKTAAPSGGQQIYSHLCQACHMANAMGGTGAATIPALANNPRLAVAAYPISMVVNGRGAMPGLTDILKPAQIAEVVGYVRTHFGNTYTKPVTAAEVLAIEAAK